MKGKLEVYAIASDGSKRLVGEGPNLVVNGAGESIVDMLTVPSSVLETAPHVMDTSNWRFGAISFAPAAEAFLEGGYYYPPNPYDWADRANPNMLQYTEDFYDDPGIDPPGDLTGTFWSTTYGRVASFSSILETNPFGGASCVELSATTDVTSELSSYIPFIKATVGLSLSSIYKTTVSYYVKKPTYGLTPSSFQFQIYNVNAEGTKNNGATFEYLNNGTVPTLKTKSTGVITDLVDAGNDWYRCSVMVSGLGGGTSLHKTNTVTAYFYIGNTAAYPSDGTPLAGHRLWISSPQYEQHKIGGNFSATPYQAVAGSAPTPAENSDPCDLLPKDHTGLINQIARDQQLRILQDPVGTGVEGNINFSGTYIPPYHLPAYPDPTDTRLTDGSTAYSIVSADGTESWGQHENRIYAHVEDAIAGDPYFGIGEHKATEASSIFQSAFGSQQTGSANGYKLSAMLVSSYDSTPSSWQADPSATLIRIADYGGAVQTAENAEYCRYNSNNGMDYRGFIQTRYDVSNLHYGHTAFARVMVSGSTVSDLTGTNSQVTNPWVTVLTEIDGCDAWQMQIHGGIHHIGLWNMDTKKALLSNAAPFLEGNPTAGNTKYVNTSTGVTKQEFKLFAKKTFTENLSQSQDRVRTGYGWYRDSFSNTQNLIFSWTIDFRP